MRLCNRLIIAWCLVMVLCACSRSPRANFYTLTAMAQPDASSTATSYSISVAPVTLPELVDRPQLVRNTEGSRVQVLEFNRWAEPLKMAIPRLLAENLSRILGTERVSSYPQNAYSDAGYRVFTDFQRFEASGQTVTVDALWSIRAPGGDLNRTGRSRISEPITSEGEEGMVTALSRALTTLSKDIAHDIRECR